MSGPGAGMASFGMYWEVPCTQRRFSTAWWRSTWMSGSGPDARSLPRRICPWDARSRPRIWCRSGSKRVCDPEAVRVFQRLKRHAERVCLEGGMRFLGGFAIPEARTEAVAAALDGLAADFAAERQRFVAGYSQLIEDWVAQHPRWEAAIRRAVEPASRVESRLAFAYQLYRVAPVEDAGSLAAEVAGLGDTLFQESRPDRPRARSELHRQGGALPAGARHLPAYPREARLSRLCRLPGGAGAPESR